MVAGAASMASPAAATSTPAAEAGMGGGVGGSDQAANHEGSVGAPRKLERESNEVAAGVIGVRLGGADPELARDDHCRPGLRLELESRHIDDGQILGRDSNPVEDLSKELALIGGLHAGKNLTGQGEIAPPPLRQRDLFLREDELPFTRPDGEVVALATEGLKVQSKCPVPQVRLEGVQMDQPQPRADVEEGAGEVPLVPAQVIEDRVVLPEAARDLTTGRPVPPALAQGPLEGPDGP